MFLGDGESLPAIRAKPPFELRDRPGLRNRRLPTFSPRQQHLAAGLDALENLALDLHGERSLLETAIDDAFSRLKIFQLLRSRAGWIEPAG